MDKEQHQRLANHYQRRHEQIAAYSRSVNGQLTRQQALDYNAIWQKYLSHKNQSKGTAMARTIDNTLRIFIIDTRHADDPESDSRVESENIPIPSMSELLLARDFIRLEYVVDTVYVKITCEDYPNHE